MTPPKISIVTPCFNQVNYIEETIRSVLDQQYPNLEYIIIDGGSTDGTAGIIKKYENHLHYWVSEPDAGMYDAVQKGFEKSSGELMAWINSDDLLHRGALNTVSEIFSTFPQVDWIQGLPSFFDEQGRIVQTGGLKKWSPFHFYLGDFRWIQQESTFWRRSLWEKAGAHVDRNLRYAGDFELWLRFFRHADLYSCSALLGGFRLRKSGQLSQTHLREYLGEARDLLDSELRNLPEEKKKTLSRIRMKQGIHKTLERLKIFNSSGFYARVVQPEFRLPPAILFDRASQSFYLK